MKWVALAIIAFILAPFVTLTVKPPTPPTHPELTRRILPALAAQEMPSEHRLPEGHICVPHKARNGDQHECHCDFLCESQPGGTWRDHESSACLTYCKRDQCSCHIDEGCPLPPEQQ